MESGLNKAFCGVYNSSREIIKNNQRHLFCNMLDLLARTTKTTGETYLNLDEFILFWATDILPLMFDEDKEIQKSAISAMESVASTFNFKTLHNSSRWNEIKTKIVQNYSKEIYKYRESSNCCWHRIWCILIRILDKEIIKGATTINAFLSIVELGFRSPDYNVRAEAFHCWKVLIEIFANNGEICSPKRIRLICIPLKSSHSRTTQAAAIKFKVWWFLIAKLNNNIDQYIEAILEPFLAFSYGSINRSTFCITDFKEMTILCLISLLGGSTKLIKKRMEYFELEDLPEPLINNNIMQKCWKSMIMYTSEALKDCSCVNNGSDFSKLLLRSILKNVVAIESMEALNFLFNKLSNCDVKDITHDMHTILAGYNFNSCMTSIVNEQFSGRFASAFCAYVITNDDQNSFEIVDKIVKSIFLLNSDRFYHVLDVFIHEMLAVPIQPIKTVVETWKLLTKCIINNFSRCHQRNCNANLNYINQWILWPLKTFTEQLNFSFQIFDNEFDLLLQTIIESLNNAIDKNTLLKELSLLLEKMYKLNTIHSELNAYLACFIKMLVSSSYNITYSDELLAATFNILKLNFAGDFKKDNFQLCMSCLKGIVIHLGPNGVDKHFGDIKDVWTHIINMKRNNHIEKVRFDDYRKQFLDDVKKVASKPQYNKIKNYLENDDLFVIIPAVWSLNPEKLTERQKEKFSEKSDIPALYNDMSQSQDAFIKPWTPKKLVIAKGHVEEIVIGDTGDVRNITESTCSSKTIDNQLGCKDNNYSNLNVSPRNSLNVKENIEDTGLLKSTTDPSVLKTKINSPIKKREEENSFNSFRTTRSKIVPVDAEEIQNNNVDDYAEQVEAIILKDTSSPPDRKQTNNSTSPMLKPKTTHLTGRGAQLINMIRNKKHENFNSKQIETSTPVTKMEPNREKIETCLNWSSAENESKHSPINLLVFSKPLPSPCASPSASILKRKHLNESMDDVYETQSFKRKRVSFHDPPVSITKEYLKDEESKNNSKRCLLLDQELKGTTKHLLRRSAKIDSQSQSEKIPDCTPIKNNQCSLMNCEDNVSKNDGDADLPISKAPFSFLFKTESDVLNYVVNHISIENICEKYFSYDKSEKVGMNLSKFISNVMNVNSKFKSTVLDTLSEKHPNEFLEHAIQENLSSVVCDRLNSNAIVDYVCNKSQTNIACRARLFQEVQDILNNEKFADEKWNFIKKTVTSNSMSDQQLLNLIEILFENKRKNQRAVSESAIDSSSTL